MEASCDGFGSAGGWRITSVCWGTEPLFPLTGKLQVAREEGTARKGTFSPRKFVRQYKYIVLGHLTCDLVVEGQGICQLQLVSEAILCSLEPLGMRRETPACRFPLLPVILPLGFPLWHHHFTAGHWRLHLTSHSVSQSMLPISTVTVSYHSASLKFYFSRSAGDPSLVPAKCWACTLTIGLHS